MTTERKGPGRPPSGAGRAGKPLRLSPGVHAAVAVQAGAWGVSVPVAAERLIWSALALALVVPDATDLDTDQPVG